MVALVAEFVTRAPALVACLVVAELVVLAVVALLVVADCRRIAATSPALGRATQHQVSAELGVVRVQ